MATTITRTGGDTVIARTGLTDVTITSTTDVEITYNSEELWINILVLGANDAPIALEVADITTVNGVNVTAYTIEQLVQYIADNCFGIISEADGNFSVVGNLNVGASLGSDRKLSVRGQGITSATYAAEIANGNGGTILLMRDDKVVSVADKLTIGTFTEGLSKLRIVGLPTSSAGLISGEVWNDGGTLKIV